MKNWADKVLQQSLGLDVLICKCEVCPKPLWTGPKATDPYLAMVL